MALSKLYTAKDFFIEATRDIPNYPENDATYNERFNLIGRSCQIAQGLCADVVSESYMTPVVAVFSTTGKYGTTGTFNATTKVLVATMSSSFASTDVGNMVILRVGTAVYVGTISVYTSATTVTLTGDNLPSTNQASFDTITMAGTTPSGSSIDISSLNILRYGNQLNLQLLSTSTTQVVAYPRESYPRWSTTSTQNSNTIIWTLVGNTVALNKGSAVSSYGTLTFWYPRVASSVAGDTDYVDLLDGAMVQMGIIILRTIIQRRLNIPVDKEAVTEEVTSIYRSLGGEKKKEEIQMKIDALL